MARTDRHPYTPFTFGAHLRSVRESRGLSRKALGRLSGVSPDSTRSVEIARRPYPQFMTVARIAQALDLTLAELRPEKVTT
jgi:transcriptional regulator with XRE-family HTH domain